MHICEIYIYTYLYINIYIYIYIYTYVYILNPYYEYWLMHNRFYGFIELICEKYVFLQSIKP